MARYRDRHSVAGRKSDHGDAVVLAKVLRTDLHARTGRCPPTATWPRRSRYWPAPSRTRSGTAPPRTTSSALTCANTSLGSWPPSPGRTVTRATCPRPHHAAPASWLCLSFRSSCPAGHSASLQGGLGGRSALAWRQSGAALPSRRQAGGAGCGEDPTVGAAMTQALPPEAAGMVFRRCRSPSERRAAGGLLAERGIPVAERGGAGTDLFGLWDLTAPAGEALVAVAATGRWGTAGRCSCGASRWRPVRGARGWAGGWSARLQTACGRGAWPAWWPGRPAGPVLRRGCCAASASSRRVPAAPPLTLARPEPARLRTTRPAGGNWSCEDAHGPASTRRADACCGVNRTGRCFAASGHRWDQLA